MKKARIMLIAIAVLATVGGTLAFKAQKLVQSKYCTTNVDPASPTNGICTDFINAKLTTNNAFTPQFQVWYKVTTGSNCGNGSGIACNALSTTFYSEQ